MVDAVSIEENELISSQKQFDGGSTFRNLSARLDVSPGLNTGKDLVRILESLYLDSFRLYYDELGGTVIGGSFNPSLTSSPKPFRVGLGFNSQPAANSSNVDSRNVVLNRRSIIEEIDRIGRGLVSNITWQK